MTNKNLGWLQTNFCSPIHNSLMSEMFEVNWISDLGAMHNFMQPPPGKVGLKIFNKDQTMSETLNGA